MNVWWHNNPDKVRANGNRRRSLERKSEGCYTDSEWRDLCDSYGNTCLRCGKPEKLTADHVTPISKGGSSYITNIQPLCRPCNSAKGTKDTDYRWGPPRNN